ncbi:MAG: cupin domain-containing protein [Nitrososphaerota archaeon]|nr:cupin domain-containing protein [Nitrososphaerota archaeon]MDG6923870.1 cupin domain-containing protein [Nitrososphaerota archaeon]
MNLPIAEARSEIEFARVISLLDLVRYQEGSVVSRMIINTNNGNVTLFSFDCGQGLSEHTSPFDALVQVLDGEVEITISGKIMKAKAGEVVRLQAGQPHKLKAVTQLKMLLTMIRSR